MHRCFRRVLLATFDRLECVRRVTQRGTMHEAIDSIGNVERISTIDQFIDRTSPDRFVVLVDCPRIEPLRMSRLRTAVAKLYTLRHSTPSSGYNWRSTPQRDSDS